MFIYQEETREKEKEIYFCGFPCHSDVGREDLNLKTWILTLVLLNICFLFQKWGHLSCLFQFPREAKRNSPCGNIFLTTKPHINVMLLLHFITYYYILLYIFITYYYIITYYYVIIHITCQRNKRVKLVSRKTEWQDLVLDEGGRIRFSKSQNVF